VTYASPATVAGQLQRGLGRGARAVRDPELVSDCLRHSYAWDRQTDARHVYLARLVRDLGMPVGPIVARLHAAAPELGDTEFTVTLGVLGCLGRAGVEGVVDGVRDYIRRGAGRVEVLEEVAGEWPVEWWDDLLPAVRDRAPDEGLFGEPWERWGMAAPRRKRTPPRPGPSSGQLLALLRDPAQWQAHRPALRELARRPAEPELVEIVPALDAAGLGGSIGRALLPLGAAAVPAARRWAAAGGPLREAAVTVLAAHGDEPDIPVLLAEIAVLDARPDQLCGYDDLVVGLARIGYPGLPDILDRLWPTPHTYERTAYLRAYRAADPRAAADRLVEGLWDCEAGVRELAAGHVGLSAVVRDRLSYLRDDPMEEPAVRGVAAARLEG
jgi:hypothetical protein